MQARHQTLTLDFPKKQITPITTKSCLSTKPVNLQIHHSPATMNSPPNPANTVPIGCSMHPLDLFISSEDISNIQQTYRQAIECPNASPISSTQTTITSITNSAFIDLLTFDSPIPDSIIHNILALCWKVNPTLKFLEPQFSSALSKHGWHQSFTKFFLHENSSRYAKTTRHKPFIHDPVILIPFFVWDSHWVAVVCQIINDRKYFLYSDDLNSGPIYNSVRDILSLHNTSSIFHPQNAVWIHVKAVTYYPHYNKCGPCMILVLLLMATHPQILRWFLAQVILTQSFPLQQFTLLHDMLPTTVDSLHQASSPFDLGYLNVAIPNMINSIKFGQLKLTLLSTNLPHAHFKREDSLILASPTSGHIATSTTPQFTPTCTPPLVCSKQQQTLDHWTIHRPFHTGISPKDSHTLVPQPKGPRDIFTDHLLPYGTTIKPVNKTNTLRICFQNTQFAFQLYNGDIEIQQIIRNLVNLEVGIFVPISPNVNWENNSNWVRIKQLFTGVSRPVHLTAMSSTIGKIHITSRNL